MENKSDKKAKDKERQSDKLSFTFPGLQNLCQNSSLKVTFEREKLIHGRTVNVPYSCSIYLDNLFFYNQKYHTLLLQYRVLSITAAV